MFLGCPSKTGDKLLRRLRRFPATSNVAASLRLALAPASPVPVRVRIIAVPGGHENVHEMLQGSSKMSSTTIHWGRILLGGLLAEVALILAIVPLGLRLGDNFLRYSAPPGSFVMCFLGALWACRRIESHFILQGTLVGVVAVLVYIALTRAQPEPFAYIVAHALKLAGGACGGWVAERRRLPSPPQTRSRLI